MPKRVGVATPEHFQKSPVIKQRFTELKETGVIFLYEAGKDFKKGGKVRHFISHLRKAAKGFGLGIQTKETKDGNVEAASFELTPEQKAEMAADSRRRQLAFAA